MLSLEGGNVVNVGHLLERRVATRRSTNDVIVGGAIVSGGRRHDQAASRGGISPSVRSALCARISFLHTQNQQIQYDRCKSSIAVTAVARVSGQTPTCLFR